MKIIAIPGMSPGNKESIEEMANGLRVNFDDVLTWHWPHWETGVDSDFNPDLEANKIINIISEPVYIVAKSIGTFVAMKILQSKSSLVHKLILNGIPMKGLSNDDKKLYQSQLTTFDPHKLLVLQNQNDHWGSFEEVKEFLQTSSAEFQ